EAHHGELAVLEAKPWIARGREAEQGVGPVLNVDHPFLIESAHGSAATPCFSPAAAQYLNNRCHDANRGTRGKTFDPQSSGAEQPRLRGRPQPGHNRAGPPAAP